METKIFDRVHTSKTGQRGDHTRKKIRSNVYQFGRG
jgi:hypothetical protein